MKNGWKKPWFFPWNTGASGVPCDPENSKGLELDPNRTGRKRNCLGMSETMVTQNSGKIMPCDHVQIYSIIFNYIQLYSIIFNYIQLYSIIFNCIQLYSIVFNCIQLYSIVFNYSQLLYFKPSSNMVKIHILYSIPLFNVVLIMMLLVPVLPFFLGDPLLRF